MVVIKTEIKMPKCCGECEALATVDEEVSPNYMCVLSRVRVLVKDLYDKRDTNCPLVEIGTCKDCKHYHNCHKICHISVMQTGDDFYCGYFKKRGNEDD